MESIREIIQVYSRKAMSVNVLIFVFFGGWPLLEGERNRFIRFIRFMPYLVLSGLVLQICNSFYDMSLKLHDYYLLSEAILILVLTIRSLLRLAYILIKVEILENYVSDLEYFSIIVVGEKEKAIYEHYNRLASTFTICFFFLCLLFGSIFSLEALLSEARIFPARTKLPFEAAFVSPIFEILFLLITLLGTAIGGVGALGDSFIFSVLLNVTGVYKILQHKLECLREVAVKEVENMKQRKILPTLFEETTSGTICLDDDAHRDSDLDGDILDCVVTSRLETTPEATIQRCSGGRHLYSNEFRGNRTFTLQTPLFIVRDGRATETEGIEVGEGNSSFDQETGWPGDRLGPQSRRQSRDLNQHRFRSESVMARARRRVEDKHDVDLAMVKGLRDWVSLHQALIRFTDYFQEQVTHILFFELGAASLLVAIDLFQISSVSSVPKFCLWVSFLFIHVVQIFVYCWSASEVEKESSNLSDSMYLSDWLEAPASFKRSMMIIMSRSIQPVRIRGASFLPVNMEVFSNIMNSGYSYYNLVNTMHVRR